MNRLKPVLAFYYITTLVFAFINIENVVKNIIFLIFLVIFSSSCLVLMRKKEKNDIKRKIIKVIFLMFIIMLSVSLIVICSTGRAFLIPDNLITIGMIAVSILTAYFTSNYFGKMNIRYIIIALTIGYLINLAVYIVCNILGINGLNIFGLSIGHTLELHEAAFVAGVILVYLICEKKYNIWLLLLVAIFFLDFKRIGFLAIVAVLMILFLDKYLIKDKKKTVLVTKIVTYSFIALYLLLMVVFTEQTFDAINSLGINMSWRDQFYRYILSEKSQYDPLLGSGIRTTDYLLSISPVWSIVSAMHSDILRLYVENGLVLLIFYFVTFITIVSNMIKKACGSSTQLTYNLMILFTFICYSTDNLFTYYRYIFVLFALIFAISVKLKKDEVTSNATKK